MPKRVPATIIVAADGPSALGATVTLHKGDIILTATEDDGKWTFYPTEPGDWYAKAISTSGEVRDNIGPITVNYSKSHYFTFAQVISFTIGKVTLNAEEGMTWADWVNSSYNTVPNEVQVINNYINFDHNYFSDSTWPDNSWTHLSYYDSSDSSQHGHLLTHIIKSDYSYHLMCFIKGTLITLADRSTKTIEELTYNDELLVWDFDNGCFATAKPLWLQKEKKAIEYNKLIFSDGSILCTINQHRIFNIEAGKFTYPMTDETPIGTTTLNAQGEFVTLISKEIVKEEVEYYNVITDYHINCFAGNILTSNRLSNIYPIKDLKYIKEEDRHIPYEAYPDIPIEFYKGLRLSEQPEWKITSDGAVDFGDKSYNDYVKRLIENQKPKEGIDE